MDYLLLPVGLACIAAAIVHGYLGHSRLIAPAQFPHRWARGFTAMIWQYSTVTWIMIGIFIAVSPWTLSASDRAWAVPVSCVPILYGVIGNAVVSHGRHFGWMIFAVIIALATLIALGTSQTSM